MHIACILLRLILSHFVITHCSCSIPEWTCNYTWLTYPWITRVRCNLVKESSQLRWCMGETSMPLRQRMAREAVFTGECCSCAHFRPCLFHVSHLSISFSDLCRWWTLPPPLFFPLFFPLFLRLTDAALRQSMLLSVDLISPWRDSVWADAVRACQRLSTCKASHHSINYFNLMVQEDQRNHKGLKRT